MAGGSYETSFEAMQTASQHVHTVNGDVQGQINGLRTKLEHLQGAWTGDAATAFHQLMERWHGDAVKLNNTLNSIATQIGDSGKTYANQDEQQKAAMSKIAGGLQG